MPSADTPLAERPGRRRRGSPESEDLPPAPNIEPLAEGGFVSKLLARLVATLRGLGIRVLVQDAAKTLGDAYAQIRQLGSLTGHAQQAAAVVSRMKKRIGELVAAGTTRARGLTVYHELEPDLYSATSST